MHEPQQVDLLRANRTLIYSARGSHPESMNHLGSENADYLLITGPAGSVVTAYDDQLYRTGQNSVTITKTVAEPIEVDIARNFLSGELHNGVYHGRAAGYEWILAKQIHHDGWFDAIRDGWDAVKQLLGESGDAALKFVAFGAGLVEGYIFPSSSTSDNNRVDNLSSLRFGTA
jgi:hypothetical protein